MGLFKCGANKNISNQIGIWSKFLFLALLLNAAPQKNQISIFPKKGNHVQV